MYWNLVLQNQLQRNNKIVQYPTVVGMGKDSTPVGPRRTRKFLFQICYWVITISLIIPLVFFQVVEYETMSKDVNRSAYTRRILEIVGNIKKQKEEINKVCCCFQYSPFHLQSVTVFLQTEPVCYLVRDLLSKCLLFSSRLLFSCGRFLSTRKMFKRKLTSYQESWIEPSQSLMSLYLGFVHLLDLKCN